MCPLQWIISSLSTRQDTQVIRIDPLLGGLSYSGSPGLDLFSTEADAYNYVCATAQNLEPKNQVVARAILGYFAAGGVGRLLLATQAWAVCLLEFWSLADGD